MERIYLLIKKVRSHVYGTIFAFALSKFIATLEESEFQKIGDSFMALLDKDKVSNALFWLALGISVAFWGVDKLVTRLVNRKGMDKQFVDLMRTYTDDVFKLDGEEGAGFSWGTSKTISYCRNIVEGWRPEAISVEAYDSHKYQFSPLYQGEYLEFCESEQMKKIIADGDNMPRYMVCAFRENYNPDSTKLLLQLKRTEWSQTKYWWQKTQDKSVLSKEICEVYKYNQSNVPNSFCLHLVVTTNDDKVVMARISANKSGDYPETFAATIGEQIEISDYMDTDLHQNFVTRWVRRALKEEFGFNNIRWEYYVNSDSIRVLALEMEGDIFNFALIVNVQVNMTYEMFRSEFNYSYTEKEISKIEGLDYKDIPNILVNIENSKDIYHPSTYLRLLMVYLHKYGQSKTYSSILEAEHRKNKKKRNNQ